MKVRVLGGGTASTVWSRSGCLLVNGCIAFDSGGLAGQLDAAEQVQVDHVFITHAHLDHIGELAFLIDNVLTARSAPLKVWAPGPVLAVIREHLFNNQLWPDFSTLKVHGSTVLEFCQLPDDGRLPFGDLEIRWARTTHPVFSAGYLVASCQGAFLYTGDTGPTEAIWELANSAADLQAIFVETAFPNRLQPLAIAAGHLTPNLLSHELSKVHLPDMPVNIMHVKQIYQAEIEQELLALHRPFRILEGNEQFRFPALV